MYLITAGRKLSQPRNITQGLDCSVFHNNVITDKVSVGCLRDYGIISYCNLKSKG